MPKKSSNGPPSTPDSVSKVIASLPAGLSPDDEKVITEAVDTLIKLERQGLATPSYRDVVYTLRQEYGIVLSTNALQKRIERRRGPA